MMAAMPDAVVWAVAGCLFEVSLEAVGAARWRWDGACDAVTLVEQGTVAGADQFRFRAEAPGQARLGFQAGEATAVVTLAIAPERRTPENP